MNLNKDTLSLTSVFLFIALILNSCANVTPQSTVTPLGDPAPATLDTTQTNPLDLSSTLGIKITQVSLTAAQMMIDIRYQVLEPEKAKSVLDRNTKLFLIHEASGKVLTVPAPAKVGPMRQSSRAPQKGKIYFIFFANPGRLSQSGDIVQLRIGDYTISEITVS